MVDWLWARIEEQFSRIKTKLSKNKNEVENVQTQTQGVIAHTIKQPTYTADSADNKQVIYDFTAPGNGNVYGFPENIWKLFKTTSQENTEKYLSKKR